MKQRGLALALCWTLCLAVDPVLRRVDNNEEWLGVLRNRRLDTVNKWFVKLDMAESVSDIDQIANGETPGRGDPVLAFELPERGLVNCSMAKSIVLRKELKEKLPQLYDMSGKCDDGSTLFLNGMIGKVDGLSATFLTPENDIIYVDSAAVDSDMYVVYRYQDGRAAGAIQEHNFSCTVKDLHEEHHKIPSEVSAGSNRALRGLATDEMTRGFIFRIAIVTTKEYSSFHGNTIASVMASLITLLNRANGIYLRELGIYFQLIAENDKLICLDGDSSCADLPNGVNLINKNAAFMQSRGVSLADFDIGHGLATNGGGRAAYPALCEKAKAEAMTGLKNPNSDAFYVDYFSHELGHTLKGAHSFRDCGDQFMEAGAVEPGSGTSIMGYAGICGATNLAAHSDPYFNSNNLADMKDFIVGKVDQGSCGSVMETNQRKPVVSAPNMCIIPSGMRFKLRGKTPDNDESMWFSWERVDRGRALYLNKSVARFRSWKPRKVKTRHFPALYYSIFGLENSQLFEVLPKESVEMNFRFTGRKLFQSDGTASQYLSGLVGDFAYQDTKVSFKSAAKPLVLDAPASLQPFSKVLFKWETGGTADLSDKLHIYIAVKPEKPDESFDYDKHEQEPEWYILGENVPNTGSAELTIPQIQYSKQLDVMIMVRSIDESCFFYDLVSNVKLNAAPGLPNAIRVSESSEETTVSAGIVIGIVCAGLFGAICISLILKRKLAQHPEIQMALPPPPPMASFSAGLKNARRRLSSVISSAGNQRRRLSSTISTSSSQRDGRIKDIGDEFPEDNYLPSTTTITFGTGSSHSKSSPLPRRGGSPSDSSSQPRVGESNMKKHISIETSPVPHTGESNDEEYEDVIVGPTPERAKEISTFAAKLSLARKKVPSKNKVSKSSKAKTDVKSWKKKKEFAQTQDYKEEEVEQIS